ncbi:MAG: DUF4349 domain-containing protein [Pirellulales bacterium]|nr:DUF4349 domain-containing protein [Pirellulales bacterium]
MLRIPLRPIGFLCLLITGCGTAENAQDFLEMAASAPLASRGAAPTSAPALEPAVLAKGVPAEGAATVPPGFNRKIIYSADVELVVEDFSGLPDEVVALVKKFNGYIADSTLSGTAGSNRSATWRIRIPVAKFEEFVGATKGLGELVRAGTNSQDVSEEYYDVEARIRNKTKEEERLLKLLEERPGKLEEVIAIERELSRVREELERMQGRMRVLADLTSLTTVNLTINEIRDYQPPQAPSFVTRARRAFEGSLAGIQSTAESLTLALVSFLPWGVVGAVMLVPGVYGWKARRQSNHVRREASRAATQRPQD